MSFSPPHPHCNFWCLQKITLKVLSILIIIENYAFTRLKVISIEITELYGLKSNNCSRKSRVSAERILFCDVIEILAEQDLLYISCFDTNCLRSVTLATISSSEFALPIRTLKRNKLLCIIVDYSYVGW